MQGSGRSCNKNRKLFRITSFRGAAAATVSTSMQLIFSKFLSHPFCRVCVYSGCLFITHTYVCTLTYLCRNIYPKANILSHWSALCAYMYEFYNRFTPTSFVWPKALCHWPVCKYSLSENLPKKMCWVVSNFMYTNFKTLVWISCHKVSHFV